MTKHRGLSVLAVGLGSIFERAHLPVLKRLREVEIITGVEPVSTRRSFWNKQEPDIAIFECLQDALEAGRYDCAVVATYPRERAELLRSLCQAGIQVILCEKPLEVDQKGLEEIQHLIDKYGLVLVPCHTWAYSPVVAAVEQYSKKFIGHPANVYISVERTSPAIGAKEGYPQWRVDPQLSGGGILLDHGYHCLYLAQRWTDEQELCPIEVISQLDQRGVDWATRAVFKGVKGTQIELTLTWLGHRRQVIYRVAANGSAITANENKVWLHTSHQDSQEIFCGDTLSGDGIHQFWYQKLYNTFLAVLAGNRDRVNYLNQEAFSVNRAILESYLMMQPTEEISL